MAKLSVLEILSVALFTSLILWHETSSFVTEETTTTKDRGSNECDDVTCPPGKKCVVNVENGTAACVCLKRFCPLFVDLVCGSDGKTYTNDCFLQRAACNSNTNITIEHKGRCNDSCTVFECPYYGRCVVDSDNDRPKCVCPPGCPKNLDPVCGSDNETYSNECMLQSTFCERKINITVARRGRCDDCGGVKCPNYGRCDFDDAQNRSMCVCRFGCPRNRRPVCGSDNKTYSNDCVLRSVACETNTSITVLHKGECGNRGSSGLGCEVVLCPPGKICVPNNNSDPECVCTRLCPAIYRPVCGSDNVTYPNDCSRLSEACQTNRNITVLHPGRCEDGGLGCENVLCPPGKFCVPNNNTDPECVCAKMCPAIYRPVCGSDNLTYSNDCELLREACQNNTNITVIRHERCEGSRCDGISCPPRKSCDPNSGECHCDTACTKEHAPVCASNGKTYGNRCEFDVAVCLYDDNSMTVIHDGPCGTDS